MHVLHAEKSMMITTAFNARKLTWLLGSWRYLEIKHFYNDMSCVATHKKDRSRRCCIWKRIGKLDISHQTIFIFPCSYSSYFDTFLVLFKCNEYFIWKFDYNFLTAKLSLCHTSYGRHSLTIAVLDQSGSIYSFHKPPWIGSVGPSDFTHPRVSFIWFNINLLKHHIENCECYPRLNLSRCDNIVTWPVSLQYPNHHSWPL